MSREPESAGRPRFVHDLLDSARAFSDREAVRDEGGSWTYAELTRASLNVAQRLADTGVRPGDRMLCLLPGSRHFAAVLYGASRCGAILVPVSPDATDYQLSWLVDDARPVLAVISSISKAPARLAVPTLRVEELEAGTSPTLLRLPELDPGSPALLIFTSGTTSRPKGIVCPHTAVVAAATSISTALSYRSSDVVYSRLPVSFDYGLYQVLLCALAGASLVFGETETMPRTVRAIRTAGATVVPVVPTLASVLSQLARRDPRPTSVRLFTNTGAALFGNDAQGLRDAFPGAQLVTMYGMSECKRITIAEPDEDIDHPGTVGRALPGTRVFVLDPEGAQCAPGVSGQIVATGEHVMDGYWRDSDATTLRFGSSPDGFGRALYTGDYGHLDEAGRLFFEGRRDDLFKRHGLRMSTQEVEGAARDVPEVKAAACVPPTADGQLTVWVETSLTPTEVIRCITERLGSAKAPRRCIVMSQLPTTANGKIDRSALTDELAATAQRGENRD